MVGEIIAENAVEEVAKEGVVNEEVATEEVTKEEVATKEVVTEETVKEEVATEEAVKEEVTTEEVVKEETSTKDINIQLNIPDGIELDNNLLSDYTNELTEFAKNSNISQEDINLFGQNLLNRHLDEVTRVAKIFEEKANNTIVERANKWLEEFKADEEIGGKRQETTLGLASEFIRTYGGTPERQQELRNALNETGMGNNPAFIRILSNAMESLKEGKMIGGGRMAAPKLKLTPKHYFENSY